jgi:hypothetical protein
MSVGAGLPTATEFNQSTSSYDVIRKTREGWPLVTIKIEVNGDLKSTKEAYFIGWFVGLVVPIQEIFVLPWMP